MRKKIFGSIVTFGIFLCLLSQAHAQLELYTVIPPFVSRALPPNVMLLIDNSISMTRFAYFDGWNTVNTADDNWGIFEDWPCTQFDSDIKYYGYFDPDYWYFYDSNHFVPTAAKNSRAKEVLTTLSFQLPLDCCIPRSFAVPILYQSFVPKYLYPLARPTRSTP